MSDEDRTWRFQGLFRLRILRLVQGMGGAVKERNARVSGQGPVSAFLVDLLAPFQSKSVNKRTKRAGRRAEKSFQSKHALTGYEMLKMMERIEP